MKVILSKLKNNNFCCEIPSLEIKKTGNDINKLYEECINYAKELKSMGVESNVKIEESVSDEEIKKININISALLNSFYTKLLISMVVLIFVFNVIFTQLSNVLKPSFKTGSAFWEDMEIKFHQFADNLEDDFEIEKREKVIESLRKIREVYGPILEEIEKF